MKKRNLKAISTILCATLCVSMTACGKGDENSKESEKAESGKGLEIAYNLTTEDFAVFENIIKDFTLYDFSCLCKKNLSIFQIQINTNFFFCFSNCS